MLLMVFPSWLSLSPGNLLGCQRALVLIMLLSVLLSTLVPNHSDRTTHFKLPPTSTLLNLTESKPRHNASSRQDAVYQT